METQPVALEVAVPMQGLLEHWQGHRRLTRRLIEAYPEDQLFTFSVGGMRTFGQLALEMLGMAVPMLREVVGESGQQPTHHQAGSSDAVMHSETPRQELLRQWDESTAQIEELWARIPPGRLQETITAFGQYTAVAYTQLLYVIDNEIHHRGQGYVYMRALGQAPPAFWER